MCPCQPRLIASCCELTTTTNQVWNKQNKTKKLKMCSSIVSAGGLAFTSCFSSSCLKPEASAAEAEVDRQNPADSDFALQRFKRVQNWNLGNSVALQTSNPWNINSLFQCKLNVWIKKLNKTANYLLSGHLPLCISRLLFILSIHFTLQIFFIMVFIRWIMPFVRRMILEPVAVTMVWG